MRTLKLIFILSFLTGCNSVIPANFWFNFKSDNITKKFSDHGPYGGTTLIHWNLNPDKVDEYELREFAEEHNWTFNGKVSVFKFPYEDDNLKIYKYIESEQTILTFKTNWIIVEPGSGESFDALGYIFLNAERTKMIVFHRWGE